MYTSPFIILFLQCHFQILLKGRELVSEIKSLAWTFLGKENGICKDKVNTVDKIINWNLLEAARYGRDECRLCTINHRNMRYFYVSCQRSCSFPGMSSTWLFSVWMFRDAPERLLCSSDPFPSLPLHLVANYWMRNLKTSGIQPLKLHGFKMLQLMAWKPLSQMSLLERLVSAK